MVSTIGQNVTDAFWFDPACGSGVFLLSVLRSAAGSGLADIALVEFATGQLHGADICQQAADFAAFVLTKELIKHRSSRSLLQIWGDIRSNIRAVDAVAIKTRTKVSSEKLALEDLFGPVTKPLRIICNPPYVSGSSVVPGGDRFQPSYLAFTQLAWELCDRDTDEASLVLPLSVVANRASDHSRFRAKLSENGGRWTMLCFDRQPHALFGEDAKTRAAILIRRPSKKFELLTSSLLKWTSKQRASIFSEERAVPLDGVSISKFVPKLGSLDEARVYKALVDYRMRSPRRPNVNSLAPALVAKEASSLTVFVGGTAYNYLNVFRSYPPPPRLVGTLSSSNVHILRFETEADAAIGFALLSCLTTYWLWHVEADGFHLTSRFLSELPLFDLRFSLSQLNELAILGNALWLEASKNTLSSNNGGKWTYAFRPETDSPSRLQVDRIVAEALGIDRKLVRSLQQFNYNTTSIDGKDRTLRALESDMNVLKAVAT
jgi:hypothetical protein